MLVITRKPGEAVNVDGPARFTVIGQRGNRVTIGIEADPSVHILRDELEGDGDMENGQDTRGDAG